MRTALTLACGALALVGCYQSHALPVPVDAPPPRDAPPTCRASCGEPVLVMRLEHENSLHWPELLVRDGAVLALFVLSAGRHVLYRGELGGGSLSRADIPIEVPTVPNVIMARNLAGPADALALTWLEAEFDMRRRRWAPIVRQQWLDARALPMGAVRELGSLSERELTGDDTFRMAVVGTARSEAVVVLDGESLSTAAIDEDGAIGEPEVLARIEGAPPGLATTQAELLSDGRLVVAGGGFIPGEEAREAFLAIEDRSGSMTLEELPGERYDPPAHIAASGDGLGLVRLVSNPRDAADARLIAQVRDADGRVTDSLESRPAHGLTPFAAMALDVDGHPAIVWVDRDGTARVVPPPGSGDIASWSSCDGVETAPLRVGAPVLPYAETWLAAAAAGDGSGDVLMMVPALDDEESAFEVYRIPGCRLDAAF